MMQLTEEQMADIKTNSLEKSKRLRVWIDDNELTGQIGPGDAFTQLSDYYGEDTIKNLLQAINEAEFGDQFVKAADNLCKRDLTRAQCDKLLGKIEAARLAVQAKKAAAQS
jgi:hypothetical protein